MKHRLSDNNLVPDKVRLSEIISFSILGKNSTNALRTLIKKCQEMEQGLVLKNEFIRTRDIIECSICSKSVPTRDSLNDKGHCSKCVIEMNQKAELKLGKERLVQQWEALAQELKKINSKYTLVKTEKTTTIELKTNTSIRDEQLIFNIYREGIYSGDRWSNTICKHALRISSNAFNLDSRRLQKDFTSKNVAITLNKKIKELYKNYKAKVDRAKQKIETNDTFITKIIHDLKVDEADIHDMYFSLGRNKGDRISERRKKITYKNITIIAEKNNDAITYTIPGIRSLTEDGCFTPLQIKNIAKFIKNLNK